MQRDPATIAVTFVVMWLVLSAFAMAIRWIRRRHAGFGRWLIADSALLVALYLLSLRPKAPDWISIVAGNSVIVIAAVLYFEGARDFRGLSPRRWPTYLGGLITIGVLVFFLYGVPSLNARATVMSAFLAIIFGLTALTLLRGVGASTLGLFLAASLFGLCAATQVARAAYCAFGPPLNDLFASTTLNRAFFVMTSVQMALFPIGFILLADERVTSDLQDASERVGRADAEVAQRKKVEAFLRESEQRFRELADAAPVMIWVSGPDRGCTYFNRQWLAFTGRSLDAELGSRWAEGVHADDVTQCLDTYKRAFDQRQSFRMEYRLRRYDGTYRWILDNGVPATRMDGTFAGYIGSAVDITDQRTATEALSNLSGKLMETQETERAWVARELHEDLAQRAAALAIHLHSMRRMLTGGKRQKMDFQQITDQASDLSRAIERASYDAHLVQLEILGLASTSQTLCKELSQGRGLMIDFRQEGVPHLSKDVALCLFRVLQETLNNAIRHAGVPHIDVALRGNSTDIELLVTDGGVGFDPDSVGSRQGLGLVAIKERLKRVGGEIHIESKPGAGTTVRALVPLDSSRSRRKGPTDPDFPLNSR